MSSSRVQCDQVKNISFWLIKHTVTSGSKTFKEWAYVEYLFTLMSKVISKHLKRTYKDYSNVCGKKKLV